MGWTVIRGKADAALRNSERLNLETEPPGRVPQTRRVEHPALRRIAFEIDKTAF
ncbi:hypothetical protein O6W96_00215 [Sphingomonas faeni]